MVSGSCQEALLPLASFPLLSPTLCICPIHPSLRYSLKLKISNQTSLTLCIVYHSSVDLTPSICSHQPIVTPISHFYHPPAIPQVAHPSQLATIPHIFTTSTSLIFHTKHSSTPPFTPTLHSSNSASLTQSPSILPAFLHSLMLYPCTMLSVPFGDVTQYHRLRYWVAKTMQYCKKSGIVT